ncbi:4-carboxy-4-hydroxy-2-oxoadipate aldolase [Baekduia alba]|uniref:4-carboxy-4-hydroxy-2-oxoadipate aldolase/oxaloacetate decarboxylase n=1 Tax=Baekduia alba TaxID=2997333 RepID=UPI0023424363|nr:4-carboxy-4-hydroxy-2-oxoadipate aldolase/oxaloacetate decarboxylase [Baekduia alba]WCB96332.1 4-carboxy-4-hydroxy-2-oxoadipate aldolase [Baekduia alba]
MTSTNIDRPTAAMTELAELGVATVYEASGRQGLIDVPLIRLVPGARVAGPARTAECGQDDNRAVHEAIAAVEPGDILVLTMPHPRPVALVGDLLATQAAGQGAAGILVDGAVRDREELVAMGLPVWSRHVRARGATKEHRGAVDVPVTVGGTAIHPGDVVVLDADGAVCVPRARIDQVLEASRARLEREAELRVRFEAGELSYDIYGMRAADRA